MGFETKGDLCCWTQDLRIMCQMYTHNYTTAWNLTEIPQMATRLWLRPKDRQTDQRKVRWFCPTLGCENQVQSQGQTKFIRNIYDWKMKIETDRLVFLVYSFNGLFLKSIKQTLQTFSVKHLNSLNGDILVKLKPALYTKALISMHIYQLMGREMKLWISSTLKLRTSASNVI